MSPWPPVVVIIAPARIDARTEPEPSSIACFEREGRSAEVAHGREAAHQRALGLRAGGQEDEADVGRHQPRAGLAPRTSECQCASIRPASARGRRSRPAARLRAPCLSGRDRLRSGRPRSAGLAPRASAGLAVEQLEVGDHHRRRRPCAPCAPLRRGTAPALRSKAPAPATNPRRESWVLIRRVSVWSSPPATRAALENPLVPADRPTSKRTWDIPPSTLRRPARRGDQDR